MSHAQKQAGSKLDSTKYAQIAREVLLLEAKELQNTAQKCAQIAWDSIIESIIKATNKGGKLIICGVGKSGHIGSKITATLASTGTPSFFLHPTEALHGDLGMIGANDIILAISYSGESSEILAIMPHFKRLASGIITMSKAPDSALSRLGDYFLPIAIEQEACPIQAAPMSSTTLTLAMGDALAACLIQARNFSKYDFGALHPGGSLGKELFVKIADLMQRDNLPIISPQTPLKDAIITMTQKRLGSALIAEDNTLIAVLSDGDLRRAMMRDDFDINASAITYATPNPKTCQNPNLLAKEALKIIEANKIQLLVITDDKKWILGVLHIHTLLSEGITS